MLSKQKPISPHLTIYKPQISSVLSILHRVSGVVNFFVTICLVWCAIALVNDVKGSFSFIEEFFQTTLGVLILMVWTYSLCFHLCTGVRHLFWDLGFGFNIKTMNQTGWLVIALSLFIWSLVWLKIFQVV
jgi:succinate dehydrogenase / fumarate reductase, cytochrome b subunit